MTIEKFKQTTFNCNSEILYDGKVYDVEMVDFKECLIAINEFPDEDDEDFQLSWKRCENVELIN